MKKTITTTILFAVGLCLWGQNLYVLPQNGEHVAFPITQNPRITFNNGTIHIQQSTFQLANIQHLSFVANAPTNIVFNEQPPPLHVFPNPVTNYLQLTTYNLQIGDIIELFNITGRRVFTHPICQLSIVNRKFIIDMTPFPPGTYILRIANQTKQIIKQ